MFTSRYTPLIPQMLKLYDNCAALIFARNNKIISGLSHCPLSTDFFAGMVSSESESFNFKNPVSTEGAVEKWMTAVEAEMRKTLHGITKEAIFHYPKVEM